MTELRKQITFFGQQAAVACDAKCSHAWGMNSRPKKQLSDNEDDYVYLSDAEAGPAPADPGTYEGFDGKPTTPDEFPNRWCVRQCERCVMSMPGMYREPLPLHDFDNPKPNIPRKSRA
jgi:hypothetical protein